MATLNVMRKILLLIFSIVTGSLLSISLIAQSKILTTGVLVIGGGTGGVAAGIQGARSGVPTVIVESTTMLGGMLTAAGVSCTDGNDSLPGGMWEEFRQALYKHYGRKNLNSGWVSETCFEPHVGDSIFKAWAANEKKLRVFYEWQFEKVVKHANKVTGAVFRNKKNETILINTKITIDATELGDVFASAGAAYDLGMDDASQSGEKEARKKNNIIQDITWAAVLKDYGAGADKTIVRPKDYDAKKYYCCNTNAPCDGKPWDGDKMKMLTYGSLPNMKFMINWPIHGNDCYLNVVEEKSGTRNIKYEQAKNQTLGFIYFLQTELGMKNISLAEDELNGGLALIPYNREGRRVKGVVRMNINQIKDPYGFPLFRTGIAVGDYPVDHHHGQYPGEVPKIEFPRIPSFNIPLGCLIPEQLDGLIVCEKGISVTNIVNGTTRLQPVVLMTGQAAGVLAAMSIKSKREIRNANVRAVQDELIKNKCYIMPFVDVSRDDPNWAAIQKIGATGILKGVGKSEGWANKTFFYPDSTISEDLFVADFNNFFDERMRSYSRDSLLTLTSAINFLQVNSSKKIKSDEVVLFSLDEQYKKQEKLWNSIGLHDYEPNRAIKRGELAVLLDKYFMVFKKRNIDLNGKFLK